MITQVTGSVNAGKRPIEIHHNEIKSSLIVQALWFLTALLIINYPPGFNISSPYKDEDILLGLALTIGFVLIGALPYYVNESELKEKN